MISVQKVGKKFQDYWIFQNISFEIKPQESVVFIGPSGSGKSVLLKIMAGLLSPDEGQVHLATQNVGMLFQRNALFDSLTVEENLLFPLRERKKMTGLGAKELADRFLSEVGLLGSENLYPDEISGGMQKRLGIARALIVEPEIIFYDEPTAGLDPITSKTIADLIQRLQHQSGTTLITVTNDMQRAYQLADRLYLLAQGQLLEGGTPKEIQNSPHPGIQQFIRGLKDGPFTSGIV